jgi:hypothetical protein
MGILARMTFSQYKASQAKAHFAKAKPKRVNPPKAEPKKWRWEKFVCFTFTKSEARAQFKEMLHGNEEKAKRTRLPVGANVVQINA